MFFDLMIPDIVKIDIGVFQQGFEFRQILLQALGVQNHCPVVIVFLNIMDPFEIFPFENRMIVCGVFYKLVNSGLI